jgi:hypothetical protein
VLLTKSSAELRAAVGAPRAAEKFLYEAECLGEAIEQLEAQIELMRSAEARIFAALADTSPEMVEEEQPKAKAVDEAQEACDVALELDKDAKACLEAQAGRHGHTPESEASGILAAELRRVKRRIYDT